MHSYFPLNYYIGKPTSLWVKQKIDDPDTTLSLILITIKTQHSADYAFIQLTLIVTIFHLLSLLFKKQSDKYST